MATQAQKVRLAFFLLICSGVLAFFFIVLAGNALFQEEHRYYIEFEATSIGGITAGTDVKFLGITIGQVKNTSISNDNVNTIVVDISVDPNRAGSAIRTDTRATISSIGLTAGKHIELEGGTQAAALLPPGSRIEVSDSFLADITERATELADQVKRVLDNVELITKQENRIHFARLLETSVLLLDQTNQILNENRAPMHSALKDLARVSASLAKTTGTMQVTMDTLHAMLTGSKIQDTVTDIQIVAHQLRQQMEGPVPQLVGDLNKTINTVDQTFTHVDRTVVQSRDNILGVLQELEESLQNLRETTEIIREDPSVLIRGRADE
jgi:phospholipid/cholesterol/gamma-HCH transport system substrate-binding protein